MALSRVSAHPRPAGDIYADGEDFVIATFRRWLLVVADGAATDSLEPFRHALSVLLRDTTGPLAILVHVGPMVPGLPEGHLVQLTQALRLAGSRIVGIAGVLPTTGFVGAAQRSGMAALGVVGRLRCPVRSFSTTPEATTWLDRRLSEHHPRMRDGAEVTRIVESLVGRASMPPGPQTGEHTIE